MANFARVHLSSDSVIALLLLLVSEEAARVHELLQALYESGYVSTAPGDEASAGRFVAGALTARYRSQVPGEVLAALLEVQRLLTAEMHADRPSEPARLRAKIVRAGSRLQIGQADEFLEQARDWIGFLHGTLVGLGKAELEMLELQDLMSERQQAINLTTNMIEALNASAQQIADNIDDGGTQPPAPQGSMIEQSDGEITGGAGGGCPIDSDSCF